MTTLRALLALILFVAVTILLLGTEIAPSRPAVNLVAKPAISSHPTTLLAPPVYAPLSASPILSVTLSAAEGDCALAGPCTLALGLAFSTPQAGAVHYTLWLFDRCTATTSMLADATFTPTHFTTLSLTLHLLLPPAESAALIAVTATPARAQSAPLKLDAPAC